LADWESIVREHGPMAFATVWRILGHVADTEDVVQEALLEAFRVKQEQPIQNWGGLLRRLATQRALDRLRSRRLSATWHSEPVAPESEQPESVAIERELAQRLRHAVAQLPNREATVFSLRYFGDMSNSEIALTLNIGVDAATVALHRARLKLSKLLEVSHQTTRNKP
jgi:RNA polymerase sigma-70 factor, ECF subfamily